MQPPPYRVTREGHTQHVRPTGEWTPRAGPGCSDQAQAWTANCGLLSSHALLNEVHPPWPVSLTPRNLEGGMDQRPSPRKHCRLHALHIPFCSKHRVLSKVMRCGHCWSNQLEKEGNTSLRYPPHCEPPELSRECAATQAPRKDPKAQLSSPALSPPSGCAHHPVSCGRIS